MKPQVLHSFAIAVAMAACSIVTLVWKPTEVRAAPSELRMEEEFPAQFGSWTADPARPVQIVNPEMQRTIDLLYDQTLDRVYVGPGGARVMLSVAYGRDQSEAKAMHRPEACYPAQGFRIRSSERAAILLGGVHLPVVRMRTDRGPRAEPLTYWMVVSDQAVNSGFGQKIQQVESMFQGKLPDGMLVRVSSITSDSSSAFRLQEQFIRDLHAALAPAGRHKVFGRDAG